MATTSEPAGKQKNKSRTEKKAQATQPSANDKLKTIVRRLPPNLPEDIFWQSVQPWVTEETISWRVFYPGKVRKKYNVNKENISSRAYIAFRSVDQLAAFSQAYDGHVFRDKSGNESVAVVEFAPFQKVPSDKRKFDPRMGTIEQDEDYKSFLATLNTPTSKPSETETIEALVAATQPPEQPKTTPLLEALRAEKQAQRDKETILKAHAHYRAKEDLGGRKKGKQSQGVVPVNRDDGPPGPGQGRRNRRGGKRGDAASGSPAQKAKEKEATSAPSPKIIAKSPAKASPKQTPATTAKEPAKEPAQEGRPRPGIASRQFAVALAGAGVLPGGGADRKSRRERERDRKAAESTLAEGSQKPAEEDKKVEKPQVPVSPGKERSRGGRRRGDSTKGQTPPPGTVESTSESIPALPRDAGKPGILPRPTLIPGSEGPTLDLSTAESGSKQSASGQVAHGEGRPEGRGGRRRGRGRGAGRGGPPVASGS